ncbi:phage integrase family protein [Frankia torreyi]|uniref:Phage integrase family protein n=1 Tax=Frankia torreyi TaxID=1856 RepID=A0A0D8BAI2_9ACTN|nr:phage integrase family protein [Frankia torreyi]KQM02719.1 phage integrase family protein [Frankia sp. CpI1-P]
MKIKTERRCGCRDATGRKFPRGACPGLEQRGHGSWSFRFRVPKALVPLVGKTEISDSGFTTKKLAEDAAEKAVARVRAGQRSVGGLTLGTYLTDWLGRKNRLRPTTRNRYEQMIRLHLVPTLGEMPLVALRSEHIDTALKRAVVNAAERGRPIGPATVGDVHELLKTALGDALDQRMIEFNPAVGVELPETSRQEVEPWEADEVGAFLDEAAADRLAAMYELIGLHGLRRGEACGATWSGLDEERSVLTITKQIVKNDTEYGVWPPKTRSGRRKVDLDATTLGSLLAHKLAQDDEREEVGAGWDNGILPDEHGKPVQLKDLIFTHPSGRHLDPQYVTRRMQQIARRAGLCAAIREDAAVGETRVVVGERYRDPVGTWTLYVDRERVGEVTVVEVEGLRGKRARLTLAEPLPVDVGIGAELGRGLLSRRRLHDLRHASASIQLAEGVDIALVSKRLGHSTPSITAALYVHLLRSTGQKAAETVAAAVPRTVRRGHPAGTSTVAGTATAGETGVSAGTKGVRRGRPRERGAEAPGFEPGRGLKPPTALAVRRHRPD